MEGKSTILGPFINYTSLSKLLNISMPQFPQV